MRALRTLVNLVFGPSNVRYLKKLQPTVEAINAREANCQQMTDAELKGQTERFRQRLQAGERPDDLLIDAFAVCREAGRRVLGMRHYDVQLIGGIVLHRGSIAEILNGEGKTLTATLPAYLNALEGKGVHVVTVNDYLARRDYERVRPLYVALGLSVGVIRSDMDGAERQSCYERDVTYGSSSEFGFDYLRDNLRPAAKGDENYDKSQQQVQGRLHYAMIDEVDSVLIDEARTPLIISGPAHDASRYRAPDQIDGLQQAGQGEEGVPIKEESQTLATITLQDYFRLYDKICGMTGTAMTEAAELGEVYKLRVVAIPTNLPVRRIDYPDLIYRSEREKWGAVADEIARMHESDTLVMNTGEERSGHVQHEYDDRVEFEPWGVNGADVIPRSEIRAVKRRGRPIWVAIGSIEGSEMLSRTLSEILSRMLDERGIEHQVLHGEHDQHEAEMIARAGCKGAVTLATNVASRGIDILLGGDAEGLAWAQLRQAYAFRGDVPPHQWHAVVNEKRKQTEAEGREVAAMGGLHVIGTERHQARRFDHQVRQLCGRRGAPGSSRFFLSLDDELMRIFAGEWVTRALGALGMEEGQAIESRAVSRRIEEAQKKVEQRNHQIRKNLLEYDEVIAEQRRRVYRYRQAILDGVDCKLLIREMIPWKPEELGQQLSAALDQAFRPEIRKTQRTRLLSILDQAWKEHLLTLDRVRSSMGLWEHGNRDPKLHYKHEAERAFENMWTSVKQRVVEMIFRV